MQDKIINYIFKCNVFGLNIMNWPYILKIIKQVNVFNSLNIKYLILSKIYNKKLLF